MKIVIEEELVEFTTYVADDGKVFTEQDQCELYEWKQTADVVYSVFERGQRNDTSELYSSQDLADKAAIGAKHYVKPIYVNLRFWKEEVAKAKGEIALANIKAGHIKA